VKKTVRSIAVAPSAAALFSAVASRQSVDLTGAAATFPRWAYEEGEKTASTLDYAPLPASMIPQLENRLKTIGVADARVGDAR